MGPVGRREMKPANAVSTRKVVAARMHYRSLFAFAALVAMVLPTGADGASRAPLTAEYATDGSQTTLVEATTPGKAPFSWQITGAPFGGVFDSVSYFGYNTAGAGGKVVQHEPMLTWNIEQHYMQGSQPTLETYWEFRNTASTRNVRPLFLQFNRDTGDITRYTFSGPSFLFQDAPKGLTDDPAPWLQLYPGTINVRPSPKRPAQVILGTPPGEPSLIDMTYGGQRALRIHAVQPNHVRFSTGGGAILDLIHDEVHIPGPVVMTSPNGTKWELAVDDKGKLSTSKYRR